MPHKSVALLSPLEKGGIEGGFKDKNNYKSTLTLLFQRRELNGFPIKAFGNDR